MLGKEPSLYFRLNWLVFAPLLVLIILVSSIVQYSPAHYGDYVYPVWADTMGWGISLLSIVWIPLGALQEIWRNEGSFLQRVKHAMKPTIDLDAEDDHPKETKSELIAMLN
ncbi:hypothetical protein NHX12_028505 [Muraenolepis orangiensis]|uniref:Uncharacterized protein n=1 Tax=Muraenolepis orangiensis TaxID=630683 RepID=A0A9Q0EBX9_9TELE|nr:hypothetical protein NHX12_028505 [Muraenolepis orangiensis]